MPLKNASQFQVTLLLAALAVAVPAISRASTVSCRSGPGCLNGSETFDWAHNYGAQYNTIATGSTAVSNSGALLARVSFDGGGDGLRLDQSDGFDGNFDPGDPLLWTNQPGQGPVTFTFSQPLTAVGTNIQGDFFGAFTVRLDGFDAHGNLIDSALATGNSNSNGDGSALFIGLNNESGIVSARFSLVSCPCDTTDFAISSLAASPAPEPGSAILLAVGGGLLLLGRRRKIRTT